MNLNGSTAAGGFIKKPASRRRLKRERKIMKLEVQFDREIRFDLPVWCITQTRMRWSPGIRVSLRALAMAGRPKPIIHRTD